MSRLNDAILICTVGEFFFSYSVKAGVWETTVAFPDEWEFIHSARRHRSTMKPSGLSTGMRNKYILQHNSRSEGEEDHASTSQECNLGGGVRRRVNVENRQSTGFPFP